MTDKKNQREERLAAALRENLKRRKAQARAMDSKSEAPPPSPAASADPPPRSGED